MQGGFHATLTPGILNPMLFMQTPRMRIARFLQLLRMLMGSLQLIKMKKAWTFLMAYQTMEMSARLAAIIAKTRKD